MKKENIPNILTIIRFILIPFIFIAVINNHYLIGIIIFPICFIKFKIDSKFFRKLYVISS